MKAYPGKMIMPGMTGRNVVILQKALIEEAEKSGCTYLCEVTGRYDEATEKCVRWFRNYYGLPEGSGTGYFLWNRLVNKC